MKYNIEKFNWESFCSKITFEINKADFFLTSQYINHQVIYIALPNQHYKRVNNTAAKQTRLNGNALSFQTIISSKKNRNNKSLKK